MQQALNSQAVAADLGVGDRYIRKLTQSAAAKGLGVIVCKGESYAFALVDGIGGRGQIYSYTAIPQNRGTGIKPKRLVPCGYSLNPNDLPLIADASLKRFTAAEKKAVISFYHVSKVPLGYIVKALMMKYGAAIKPSSLQAKLKRWSKDFRAHGSAALADKRGGKAFKADMELVKKAVLGGGTRHFTTLFGFYCSLYADAHGLTMNYRKPSADVSESAFYRAAKHIINTEHLVKEYLHIGKDAYRYSYPSMGNIWSYPNQQWEVDATPLDLMIKVPLDANGIKDFSTRDVDAEYEIIDISKQGMEARKKNKQTRVSLVRVIDNFTNATVHMVVESSNSMANARLLHKAFSILGKGEVVRSDRGSDYISKHLQGVLEALGMEAIILPPASGNQKGMIERSFRTLQHSPEFEALPGFIGHNVNQRQHLENEASTKRDKKSNVATNIKGDFLWHWEVESWIENYLQFKDADKYAQHENQRFSEAELSDVFRLLGRHFTRKVSAQGIAYNNTHYMNNDLWMKHLNIGDKVVIRENIDDTTRIFVFKDEQYIGEAMAANVFMQSQTVEQSRTTQKGYKKRTVKHDRKIMSDATQAFGTYQNGMRDEFIGLAVAQAETKKEFEEQADEVDGFDPMAAVIKLANAAMG